MSLASNNSTALIEASQRMALRISEKDLYPLAVRIVLFFAFFGNTIDIESHSNPTVGINFQAGVKAALVVAAGCLGAIGWWRIAAVRTLLMTPIGWLSMVLAFLYFATTLTSVDPKVSLVCAVAFVSYLLLVPTALVLHGINRVLQDAVAALFLFLCAVWFTYLVIPEVGVFMEAAGTDEVARMSGLGHPNALGRSASIFAILMLLGYRNRQYSFWFALLGISFGFLSLWESLSRTAMVACLGSMLLFNRDWLRSKLFLASMGPACFLSFVGLIYVENRYGLERVVQKVLVGTSKTGDAEEITSATGRTEIWAFTWELIKQRPLTGYGAGTSPLLMENYSHHTHSIVLNPMLSMGVFGGVVIVIWLLINIRVALLTRTRAISAITFFILISGLTENTILPTYPEICTLSWLIASYWPYLETAYVTEPMHNLSRSPVPA
jgi:exopolysaccharide production protein ExoQ